MYEVFIQCNKLLSTDPLCPYSDANYRKFKNLLIYQNKYYNILYLKYISTTC